jgi:hypothetical protein
MDWLPIAIDVILRAVSKLAPVLCDVIDQRASRAEQRAVVQSDHWKCPSDEQISQFLLRSSKLRSAAAPVSESRDGSADFLRESDTSATAPSSETGAGPLPHGSACPLWDRELDA